MLPTLLLACAAAICQDPDALIRAGNELLDRDDAKAALLKFEKAIDKAPNRADAYVGRARALGNLKLLEDAENDLNRALELDPTMAQAYYFRGRMRYSRGACTDALADLEQCFARGGRYPQVFMWKGLSLNKLGRFSEAEEQFTRALSEGAPTAQAYSGRAAARIFQGNLRGALSDETRSIELDPADGDDYLRRATAYYGAESWENALRDFRKARELHPNLRTFALHWIFLCRWRMEGKEAAVQELRSLLKENSGGTTTAWLSKLLSFDLGELSAENLLESSTEQGSRCLAHLTIGTFRQLDGKADDALEHFRKASTFPLDTVGYPVILARAAIERQVQVKVDRIVEELEAKVRALPLFEATYDVDMRWSPEDEKAFRSLTWTVDMKAQKGSFVVRGRNNPLNVGVAVWVYLKDLHVYTWEAADDRCTHVDFSFMPTLYDELDRELKRLIPSLASMKEERDRTAPALTLELDGKPSKDGEGTIRFTTGFAGSPCGWLKERPGPADLIREEKDEIVFEFPAKRKKMVLDRQTGLLKLLETLDYDGTRRAIRLASYKSLDSWPKIPRPEKEKPAPSEVAQFKNRMLQQEQVLQGMMSAMVERWAEVEGAKKEDQAAAIVTRWAARYADGFHAHAVRSLAGNRIKAALDLGTPVSAMVKNAETDARQFAAEIAEDRKSIDGYLKSTLAELAERMENGLFERPVDSRAHAAVRSLVKKALDPQAVERQRKATYQDRLEELYKEELRTRTQL